MPGCASCSIPDGPSEGTLRWLRFPFGLAAPRFTVNLARFTKTRDCISCFGSTISGMRFFTKSWICIARLYIPALCISIFGPPFKFLVIWFPLTPLHFHHFRASSLPRRSTHARIWTPPFRCVSPMGLMPGTNLKPGLQSSTHSMHLANEFDARLQHPFHLPVPPLCRNLLLPRFCCLIRLCKLQVMACPRDVAYHLCVAD